MSTIQKRKSKTGDEQNRIIQDQMLRLGLALVMAAGLMLGDSPPMAHAASIIRVTATGADSAPCGEDWITPCDLQFALTEMAGTGDEIWVKEGEYKPGTDREDTFILESGMALYGGFAGDEISRDARDWETHVTVLSGDIGGAGDSSDNSYHVLTGTNVDATAVLDGFTITAGNANSSTSPQDCGGGLYLDSSNPVIQHVVFSDNKASTNGGGMYTWKSSPTLIDVAFGGNTASANGGGLAINRALSAVVLTDIAFRGNTAGDNGGGMRLTDSDAVTMTNVLFTGNSADQGGGLHCYNSQPTLVNATFSRNEVTSAGGGIYGGVTSSISLYNGIVWGNALPQIYATANSTTTVTYSDAQGGYPGAGNVDVDPQFVDADGADDTPGTDDDDLDLRPTSPVADAGDNTAPGLAGIATDLGGTTATWT